MGILVDKFKEGLKEINENPELKMLKEFGEQAENHFLYENDGVTEFISEQMDKLITSPDAEETKQKKVLIIDDLDRLDPEHIFRLFNVFSAHFDQVNYYENSIEGEIRNDNKFGFDKIIFVCDIENIRKIFAHKYGGEVDFSGYIDKFYSTEIYQMIHKDSFDSIIYPYLKDTLMRFNTSGYTSYYLVIKYFVEYLFTGNQLSLRDIQKLKNFRGKELIATGGNLKEVEIPLDKLGASYSCLMNDYGFLVSLKLLSYFFESNVVLLKKIKAAFCYASTDSEYVFRHEAKKLVSQLILFAEKDVHKFSVDNGEFQYDLNEALKLNYTISKDESVYREDTVQYRVNFKDPKFEVSKGNFYYLLKKASEVLLDSGVI